MRYNLDRLRDKPPERHAHIRYPAVFRCHWQKQDHQTGNKMNASHPPMLMVLVGMFPQGQGHRSVKIGRS
jgi:hypothetical protein